MEAAIKKFISDEKPEKNTEFEIYPDKGPGDGTGGKVIRIRDDGEWVSK